MIPYTCAYMCILHVCACVHTHTKLPLKFKENSGKLASIQQQILIWHWFVVYLFKIGSHVVWATLNRWWPLTPDPPGSTSKSWNKQPPPHLFSIRVLFASVYLFFSLSHCVTLADLELTEIHLPPKIKGVCHLVWFGISYKLGDLWFKRKSIHLERLKISEWVNAELKMIVQKKLSIQQILESPLCT